MTNNLGKWLIYTHGVRKYKTANLLRLAAFVNKTFLPEDGRDFSKEM